MQKIQAIKVKDGDYAAMKCNYEGLSGCYQLNSIQNNVF